MKKNNPKSAVRQGENKQAGELFLDRIENYLRTAPSDDIRTLTTPDMASQFALMRLFQRLKCPNPDASQEGIARMRAELHYRLATRDGLKVQRIGSKVVENTASPQKELKPGGKKHTFTGKDKWLLSIIINEVIRGNRKAGIEPLEGARAKAEIERRIKTDPVLKTKVPPSPRMLDNWIEDVKSLGEIRGSVPINQPPSRTLR